MPLVLGNCQERYTINKVVGVDKVRVHLAKLGFVKGAEVSIISKMANNYIVCIKESRIALDESLCRRIIV